VQKQCELTSRRPPYPTKVRRCTEKYKILRQLTNSLPRSSREPEQRAKPATRYSGSAVLGQYSQNEIRTTAFLVRCNPKQPAFRSPPSFIHLLAHTPSHTHYLVVLVVVAAFVLAPCSCALPHLSLWAAPLATQPLLCHLCFLLFAFSLPHHRRLNAPDGKVCQCATATRFHH
jgi:hypothetical protein